MKTGLRIFGIILLALFTSAMSECDSKTGTTGGSGGTNPIVQPTTPKDKLAGTYNCVLYLRKLGEGNEINQLVSDGTLNLGTTGIWTLNLKSFIAPISWSGTSWDANTTDLILRTADGSYRISYKSGDNVCQQHPLLRVLAAEADFIISKCDLLLILDRGYMGFRRN